jgi:hypothetical protein
MTTAIKPNLKVVSRQPMDELPASYSAATLERVMLGDGRRLVYKHLPAEGDWLSRASGGIDRPRRLWESGLLARISHVVDHTIVDVIEQDGHDVIVMRDAHDDLFPPHAPVSRADSRRLLTGLAALHDAGETEPIQPLCPIAGRYGMFAPDLVANDPGPNAHPSRDYIVTGWTLFPELVDADLVSAVFAVHRDPELLGRRLADHPPTLLHGDAKLANLGLGPQGLVAIDWGELTGFGPREIDVAWYAQMNSYRLGTTPDVSFADYEAAAGRPLDPEALDLACIGSLAQMGGSLAYIITLVGSAPNSSASMSRNRS